jgi:glycosyltransferase involved in cell wall biosynthesis
MSSPPQAGASGPPGGNEVGQVLGIIIPARNEAAVIERKLRNLMMSRWPFSKRPHQIVVVDDGSEDETASIARGLCESLFANPSGSNRMMVPALARSAPAAARVISNDVRPGKAGAIEAALAALGDEVDLFVLTDADVIIRPPSLLLLEHAFRDRPELGMACGRQEFVRDLASDGTCRGADEKEPVDASDPYDRWTAKVRAWESKRGRLFSVHGQLLVWRASLGLSPTPGIAADDLDLMLQARVHGVRIEIIPGPSFLEVKTSDPAAREAQEIRRARAYLQVMKERGLPADSPLSDRLQLAMYRNVPNTAPLLWTGMLALNTAAGMVWAQDHAPMWWRVLLGVLAGSGWAWLASPSGRHALHLAEVIRKAKRMQAGAPLGARWDMARP